MLGRYIRKRKFLYINTKNIHLLEYINIDLFGCILVLNLIFF